MSCEQTYVGLEPSLATTAIWIVDDDGAVRLRGSCPSDPAILAATIRRRAPGVVRVGLETGQTSSFLTRRCVAAVCPSSASMPATPRPG